MEKTYVTTNGRKAVAINFRPTVPTQVAPAIAKEYNYNGMRMYLTKDGRQFNADIYDANFKVKRTALLPRARGMSPKGHR